MLAAAGRHGSTHGGQGGQRDKRKVRTEAAESEGLTQGSNIPRL